MNTFPPKIFQEEHIPNDTTLVGLAALVHRFGIQAPVRTPACVSAGRFKEGIRQQGRWRVFDNKYKVEDTTEAHLSFAIKHEHLDLLVLKRIFEALPEELMAEFVASAPTGPITRRLWYLCEYLTGKQIAVPDCGKVAAVDLLDPKQYFVREDAKLSSRHKVRNNLLGDQRFAVTVRRTERLRAFVSADLKTRAAKVLQNVGPQLIARAASFLLLADSQASFAIEGERLPRSKAERWLRAVQQAGSNELTKQELHRLHAVVIEDRRFVQEGFRKEGVFLGHHTQEGEPLPEFIGARADQVEELIDAWISFNQSMSESGLDAVLQATATAFGFVFIHPYEDGNGRLHRWLIHHVLAEREFNPPGLVFPVSSVMLNWIADYRRTLQNQTSPLMPFIDWTPTPKGNVEVINDTADFYRFFDCTEAAEFLYSCVQEAIDNDIPLELEYLQRHDRAMRSISARLDMPDRIAESFIAFMRQNEWRLPKKRRENEFAKLTDKEVAELESAVREAFDKSLT